MARRRNIMKRGKSWVVYFRVEGQQVWKSFKTREEAELYLARAQAKKAQGNLRAPSRVTLDEAAEEWLRYVEHEGGPRGPVKPSTLDDYKSGLQTHILPRFG